MFRNLKLLLVSCLLFPSNLFADVTQPPMKIDENGNVGIGYGQNPLPENIPFSVDGLFILNEKDQTLTLGKSILFNLSDGSATIPGTLTAANTSEGYITAMQLEATSIISKKIQLGDNYLTTLQGNASGDLLIQDNSGNFHDVEMENLTLHNEIQFYGAPKSPGSVCNAPSHTVFLGSSTSGLLMCSADAGSGKWRPISSSIADAIESLNSNECNADNIGRMVQDTSNIHICLKDSANRYRWKRFATESNKTFTSDRITNGGGSKKLYKLRGSKAFGTVGDAVYNTDAGLYRPIQRTSKIITGVITAKKSGLNRMVQEYGKANTKVMMNANEKIKIGDHLVVSNYQGILGKAASGSDPVVAIALESFTPDNTCVTVKKFLLIGIKDGNCYKSGKNVFSMIDVYVNPSQSLSEAKQMVADRQIKQMQTEFCSKDSSMSFCN